jgi:hypothetical protein
MMRLESPTLMLAVALAAVLGGPSVAPAQVVPVNACAAAKAKCVAGQVKRLLRCHQTAENRGLAVDPRCVLKTGDKFLACLAKAETALPCLTLGDAAALGDQIDAAVTYLVLRLDPSYPEPIVDECSAAKKKAVATTMARRLLCLSRAFKKTPGLVDAACLAKAELQLSRALAKVESKLTCSTTVDAAALENTVALLFADWIAVLSGTGAACGNHQNDVGEACDASAPSAGWSDCGAGAFCANCTCGCPTRYEIAVDASDPASVLDLGWTGLGHRQPFSTDHTLTLGLACVDAVSPCGTCSFTQPVENAPGRIPNRRCSNDTAIRCTSDAPCAPGGGACRYYLGSWHPRGGFGLGGCIAHELNGPVGGTVDLATGEIGLTSTVTRRSYIGAIDTPCPRCMNDVSNNDGIPDGTCAGGSHDGDACDGNATAPGFPDFGVTSLDCPPMPSSFVADVQLALASSTQSVVRSVTASSPNCSDGSGEKCLCETCNSANAEPCGSNADCPIPDGPIGPICGGRRCLGGANHGTPCTVQSACPAGLCGSAGETTKTSACLDDTATPGLDCVDTAPFDGEGECVNGPVYQRCSVASGHPQRGCSTDTDCGGGVATCQGENRSCFLTGSAAGFGRTGTGTLAADGAADPPIQDVAHPVLAAVGCTGATAFAPLNVASGFPGPVRLTEKVTATALP